MWFFVKCSGFITQMNGILDCILIFGYSTMLNMLFDKLKITGKSVEWIICFSQKKKSLNNEDFIVGHICTEYIM